MQKLSFLNNNYKLTALFLFIFSIIVFLLIPKSVGKDLFLVVTIFTFANLFYQLFVDHQSDSRNIKFVSFFILFLINISSLIRFYLKNYFYFSEIEILQIFSVLIALLILFYFIFPLIFKFLKNKMYLIFISTTSVILFELVSISKQFMWTNEANLFTLTSIYLFVLFFIFTLLKLSNSVLFFVAFSFSILNIFNTSYDVEDFENYSKRYIGSDEDLYQNRLSSNFLEYENLELSKDYNIYLLVYDGYPNKNLFDYYKINKQLDITEFLKSDGFEIYENAISLSSNSSGTMSRVLDINKNSKNTSTSKRITGGEGMVFEILKNNSYETFGVFESDYFISNSGSKYDNYFPPNITSTNKVLNSYLKGYFDFTTVVQTVSHDYYKENKSNILAQISDDKTSNKFIYSHSRYPGHTQNSGKCLEEEKINSPKFNYDERIKIANEEIIEDLSIIKNDYKNSIIIIASDHGPWLTKNCYKLNDYKPEEIENIDILDRQGVLLAIRWPEEYNIIKSNHLYVFQNLFVDIFSFLSGVNFNQAKLVPALDRLIGLPEGFVIKNNQIFFNENYEFELFDHLDK